MQIVSTVIFGILLLFNSHKSVQNNISTVGPIKGDDRCTEWLTNPDHKGIDIKICEYESGGSGYITFRNRYDKAVTITYVIYFNNGTESSGTKTIDANSESDSSACYRCAQKNGGARSWSIRKFRFEED